MPPDKRVHIGVAAAVTRRYHDPSLLNRRTQLLMIRRVGNTGFAADGYDTWSMPGGWLEHGEDPVDAAVREVKEETGLTVRPFGVPATNQLGVVVCPSAVHDISIVTLFIRCAYIDGEPQVTEPDKCADPQWIDTAFLAQGELPLFAPLEKWIGQGGLHRL